MAEVYALIRESDDTIRYIGWTSFTARKRFREHKDNKRRKVHTPVYHWMNKYEDVTYKVLHTDITNEETIKLEKKIIAEKRLEAQKKAAEDRKAQAAKDILSIPGNAVEAVFDLGKAASQAKQQTSVNPLVDFAKEHPFATGAAAVVGGVGVVKAASNLYAGYEASQLRKSGIGFEDTSSDTNRKDVKIQELATDGMVEVEKIKARAQEDLIKAQEQQLKLALKSQESQQQFQLAALELQSKQAASVAPVAVATSSTVAKATPKKKTTKKKTTKKKTTKKKTTHKYKSRKKVNGKWVYKY